MQVKRKSFLMILLVIVLTFSVGLLAFANNYQAGAQSSVENESNVLTQGIKQTSVKYYNVEIANISHGTITADKTVVEAGDTVVLTIVADYGYMYKQGSLFVNGGTVPIGGHAFFIMPNKDVIVTAEFESNGTPLQDYTITILESENGTVIADKQTAKVGETVTLDIAPDLGYKLVENSLKVNDGTIEITDNTFVMPASDVFVSAEFEEEYYSKGLKYRLINNDTEYEVAGIGTCTDVDLVVPSKYMGKAVVSIGENTFNQCDIFSTIDIPRSVKIIGKDAFLNCLSLKSVKMVTGIESLGYRAFAGCKNLIAINIPDSVTEIGFAGFSLCNSLSKIEIPFGVSRIEDSTFSQCKNLREIILPESLEYIGVNAFFSCSMLVNMNIPSSVKIIDTKAFMQCTKLVSIILPENMVSIGACAFGYCESLKNIIIPTGITKMEEELFTQCTSLIEIIIPKEIISIANGAFNFCSSLESITVESGNEKYHSVDNCIIETETKTLIVGCKKSIIPSDGSVVKIADYAFMGSNILSIVIPKGVEIIGRRAFYACRYLSNVTFSNTVTTIGSYAFYNCIKIVSVIIPNSVVNMDNDIFRNSSEHLLIKCEASVKPIGWGSNWNVQGAGSFYRVTWGYIY